jgi:hypothetical protein
MALFNTAAKFLGFAVEKEGAQALARVPEEAAAFIRGLDKLEEPGFAFAKGPEGLVFHGTKASVEDITQLSAKYSSGRGVAGPGIYVTQIAEEAGKYAGPADVALGGRVVAGKISPGVRLLNANAPITGELQQQLTKQIGKPVRDYLDAVSAAREAGVEVEEIQKTIFKHTNAAGVSYEASYSAGKRQAFALFGQEITGRGASELFSSTVPSTSAQLVKDRAVTETIMHFGQGNDNSSMLRRSLHSGTQGSRKMTGAL